MDGPSLVPLNTLDYASCSVYRNYDNSTQLCVDGRQSCYGDEGEALLVATNSTYALVGMASYAVSGAKGAEPSACGEANNVSYFESTSVWAQWIANSAQLSYSEIIVRKN
ncbi:hypothetical protein GGI09_007527, partial [Coemansia sp. S100]